MWEDDDDEEGYVPLFELFHIRSAGPLHARARGILSDVSPTSTTCTLRSDTAHRAARLPWERRAEHLAAVVAECTAFRLAAEVENDVVVRAVVEVHRARFGAQMQLGATLAGEVALVGLLAACWRDLVRLPHAQERPLLVEAVQPVGDGMDDAALVLWAHQRQSLAWMQQLEELAALTPLRYEGNLPIADGWYVDTERECFTRDPSWREARVRGGVLADWAGAGKTAIVLRHCAERPRPTADVAARASRGTLVVLPLNLTTQWLLEAARFCPTAHVVDMTSLRLVTLDDLLHADVVLTTFQFLRENRSYAHLVEEAVCATMHVDRRHARSRAAVAAYGRQGGRAPILESVHWHRIVVDEMHEALSSARNQKALSTLSSDLCWGVTATPDAVGVDAAQQHYWLLQREKAHHPNLLHHLLHRCIRCTRPTVDGRVYDHGCRNDLIAVHACHREREGIARAREGSLAEVVRQCTAPHEMLTDEVEALDADALLARHRRAQEVLQRELALLPAGDEARRAQLESCIAAEERRLGFVRERIGSLVDGQEQCSVCQDDVCGVMLPCAHTFCRRCIAALDACPLCRHTEGGGMPPVGIVRYGTKLTYIAQLCASLNEPVILVAQWKQMLHRIRAVLRGRGIETHTLEGNGQQRRKALRSFEGGGGVLLLNLNDSFAGLHLPHAQHIVFSHAIVADRDAVRAIEYQAIARCLRHGQTGDVRVYSLVMADCEEEALWHVTHDSVSR